MLKKQGWFEPPKSCFFFFSGVAMSSLIFLRQIELVSSHEEVSSSVATAPEGSYLFA